MPPEKTEAPNPADIAPKNDPNPASADGTNGQDGSSNSEPQRLPDDHPLVTAYARQKAENEALRDKARRLDEIEESKKSEAEKAADRIAKAEAEAAAVPEKVSEQLREHLVRLHEISDDDAELFLTASDPEVLLRQAARLVEGKQDKQRNGIVPTQGTGDAGKSQVSSYELGAERARARYHQKN